jgi:hypothetical protein
MESTSYEGPYYAVFHSPVTFFLSLSLCGPDILLSTLFSNTLSLCSKIFAIFNVVREDKSYITSC